MIFISIKESRQATYSKVVIACRIYGYCRNDAGFE